MKCAATLFLALAATVVALPAPQSGTIVLSGSDDAALLNALLGQAGNTNNGAAANANANANTNTNTKGAGAGNAAAAGSAANAANASVNAATQQQVSSTIQKWLSDIATVNNFVDTASQLTDAKQISDFAAQTFVAAQDEGASNTALQQAVQLDASGLSAAQDLLNQFNIIGPAINDTISNPQNLQKNLDAINGARCPPPAGNGAIFEEGAVQQSAATAAGVQAALPAIPAACGTLAQAALAKQQGGAADAAQGAAGAAAGAAANATQSANGGKKGAKGAAAAAAAANGQAKGAAAKQAKAGDAQANAE